jgi:hypothetical protein
MEDGDLLVQEEGEKEHACHCRGRMARGEGLPRAVMRNETMMCQNKFHLQSFRYIWMHVRYKIYLCFDSAFQFNSCTFLSEFMCESVYAHVY